MGWTCAGDIPRSPELDGPRVEGHISEQSDVPLPKANCGENNRRNWNVASEEEKFQKRRENTPAHALLVSFY